jgi:tetratricopeptide (TPR) repeat protein
LLSLGRAEDARASFAEALAIEPQRLDALNNLGLALIGLKRAGEALESYDRVLAVDPEHRGALHNRANALAVLERFEEALAPCDRLLAKDPADADALNTRGVVLGKLGRHAEALASYDAALAAAPDRVDVHVNRGATLLDLDRIDDALSSFDRALTRDPGHLGAMVSRGNAFRKDKRYAEALVSYDEVLAIKPDQTDVLNNRGVALAEIDRIDEALACYEKVLRVEPNGVAAHVNRGNAFLKSVRMEEALASYGRALALEPDNVDANFNAALTRLCMGDYHDGWKQYEYRWKRKDLAAQRGDFSQPAWDGQQDLTGKTVLLHAEQGLGDTLQFVRYAPLVAARGAKVLLAVQPPLKMLMCSVPGVSAIFADGDVLPDFDLHCALLSLPLAFGTKLETIPATIPYVCPYPERIDAWRPRLPQHGRRRIGLCWAGNPVHSNDRNRSMQLEYLRRVLSVPGLDFVSVQKAVSDADAAILREHGVAQLGQEFADFSDTAAVIAMLDLIIAVDTSVAHLAGAMGKAVALLIPYSPDWRWLRDRTDSPWYPSMRIFRQKVIGDWSDPVERVRCELEEVARRSDHAAAQASRAE